MQSGIHPQAIYSYVQAANRMNAESAAACFAEHAIVEDEGCEYRGRASIQDWVEETSREYQPEQEILRCEESEGAFIVTSRVSGNFPGSPAELQFRYTLEDGLISRLSIQ